MLLELSDFFMGVETVEEDAELLADFFFEIGDCKMDVSTSVFLIKYVM
tara:strand:+ start:60 stop:203 length:144 start_codon:yes stop_codon:yes gene_type:complete